MSGLKPSVSTSDESSAYDPLGPDLFGLLRDVPPPSFLAGHDYSELSSGRAIGFLRALDMVSAVRPSHEGMAPTALRDHAEHVEEVRWSAREPFS